jgi:hypothetical protein
VREHLADFVDGVWTKPAIEHEFSQNCVVLDGL